MAAASIRPVTRLFASSRECQDDSSLPFACVLTPLSLDHQDSTNRNNTNEDVSGRTTTDAFATRMRDVPSLPLTCIDKCLHCGAPHPDRHTHFRPNYGRAPGDNDDGGIFVCLLCGRSSSASRSHQAAVRAKHETTSRDEYRILHGSGYRVQNQQAHVVDDELGVVGDEWGSSTVFSVPLRLPSLVIGGAAGIRPPYSVPAMACPPLWFVVLDGGSLASSSSSGGNGTAYWQSVSRLLIETVQTMPPHVHMSILIAGQRQPDEECVLGILDWNHGDEDDSDDGLVPGLPVCERGKSSNFDLMRGSRQSRKSTIPIVRNYISEETCCREEDLMQAVLHSLAPLHSGPDNNAGRLDDALQALRYYQPFQTKSSSIPTTSSVSKKDDSKANSGDPVQESYRLPVGWTTEVILAALQTYAAPAGHRHVDPSELHEKSNKSKSKSKRMWGGGGASQRGGGPPPLIPYAGGKVTFLLADQGLANIEEEEDDNSIAPGQCDYGVGHGGIGGRIHGNSPEMLGRRFEAPATSYDASEEEAPVVGDNRYVYSSDDVEAGTARVSNGGVEADGSGRVVPDTAGAWAPIGLMAHYKDQLETDVETYYADLGKQCAEAAMGVDLLCLTRGGGLVGKQAKSQPLDKRECVPDFGLAILQVLASKSGAPGPLLFDVMDKESWVLLQREIASRAPWSVDNQGPMVFGAELRVRISPGFLVDDVSVVAEPGSGPQMAPLYCEAGLAGPASPVDESSHLWRMGTCDPYTSFTIDLIHKDHKVKDRLRVAGVGEIAFKPVIQTCFAYTTIVKDLHDGHYRTVRQMRISCCPVPLVDDMESLYGSLDPEALAVVLFHKLAVANLQDGPEETAEIAHNWLQALLVSVYRSAEDQDLLSEERKEKGLEQPDGFYPNERLLDREGELPAEEVLLAQGHELLQSIPLMVYLLLQSDCLRPSAGSYRPSLDLRVAATMQMASMTPGNLARCIAPRLQLWGSCDRADGDDNDDDGPIVDVLDLKAKAVRQALEEYGETGGLILLLDSPDQITLMNASCVDSVNKAARQNDPAPFVGPSLRRMIDEISAGYRTPPPIVDELSPVEHVRERSMRRLSDVLIEDTHAVSGPKNFDAWRSMMAAAVNDELLEEKA